MSSFTSFGFRYKWDTSHTLTFEWGGLWGTGGVPSVKQVYTVTIERNGIESILSTPVEIIPEPFHRYPDIQSGAVGVRVNCVSGDVVRLYRATEGQYVLVASGVADGYYIDLDDWGGEDTGEFYHPSGKLPYGPAVVVGSRVAIATGRTLWISQAGSPTRFGATAINDDNLDAFSVVLPAAISALAPAEGGIVAHTKRGQYMVPLAPSYDNDLLHVRPPVLIDDRAASDFRAAAFGAFISDGRLYVDGQLLAPGLDNSSWVIRTSGRVYIVSNSTCYVWSPAEWAGAVRWTLPAAAQWVFVYGDDVFVATASGIYKLAGASSRRSSCRWRTGKRFMPMLSAIRFLHIAGDAYVVRLIRPGKSDVVLTNVSGRTNVPAGEQSHEWQLELNVAQSDAVHLCFVSYETGVQ